MRNAPVHAMRPDGLESRPETWCGIVAWPSTIGNSEADTPAGERIEILGGINHRATCRKCIGARNMAGRSIGGMSGTRTALPGNSRGRKRLR